MISIMVKEKEFLTMENDTKDSFKKENITDKESIFILMEQFIKGNGEMAKSMEKVK